MKIREDVLRDLVVKSYVFEKTTSGIMNISIWQDDGLSKVYFEPHDWKCIRWRGRGGGGRAGGGCRNINENENVFFQIGTRIMQPCC